MIYLYRIYQILIVIPLFIVITLLTCIIVIVMCLVTNGRFWGFWPPTIWATIFCKLNFIKVTVKGRENIKNKTSYVFVANHQGACDIFSIGGYLRHNFRWVMKASLIKIPFVGFACKISRNIFMDRTNAAKIRKSMEYAEKQLAKGMSLVVFPEGSRTKTGALGSFKRGAFMLANEFSLPVVPITVDGSYKVMPRTAKLPRPGHIILTIHKPIYPGPEGYDLPQLIQESQQAVASAL